MPNLLGDIVEELLGAFPRVDIVGRPPSPEGPIAAAHEAGADIVLLQEDDDAVARLEDSVGLDIFALAASGREGALLSVRRRRIALDEAGLARLGRLLSRKGHH